MILELVLLGGLLALALAVYGGDDREVGNDGVVIIDTAPGTPITLDAIEFEFLWKPIWKEGRTFGNRATGRTFVAMDWEANVTARVRETGTTPNFFREGAVTGFSLKTDNAPTPAIIIAGNGAVGDATLRVREGELTEYALKLLCHDPDETNLPTRTLA